MDADLNTMLRMVPKDVTYKSLLNKNIGWINYKRIILNLLTIEKIKEELIDIYQNIMPRIDNNDLSISEKISPESDESIN